MEKKKCVHIRATLDKDGLLYCRECGMKKIYPVGQAVRLDWIEYISKIERRVVYGSQIIYPQD